MTYFDNYFKFPSIQVDGDYELLKEERKEKAIIESEIVFQPEFIVCETEIHASENINLLSEAWYPSEEGVIDALDNGNFPCTRVTFSKSGQFLIPWRKEEFKKNWEEFHKKSKFENIKFISFNNKNDLTTYFENLLNNEIEDEKQ